MGGDDDDGRRESVPEYFALLAIEQSLFSSSLISAILFVVVVYQFCALQNSTATMGAEPAWRGSH